MLGFKNVGVFLEELITVPFFFRFRDYYQRAGVLNDSGSGSYKRNSALGFFTLSVGLADYAVGSNILQALNVMPEVVPDLFNSRLDAIIGVGGYGLGVVGQLSLRDFIEHPDNFQSNTVRD